ncbi:thiol reductant ABC exporter subunit CydC [Paeniglutamicibacter antarcticus]|uniref:Thiol reductant ABC exporter subunit CydC n=1 Tax=Paeniglutamicibacter antarcticus TaxID=494023 RepID=A0ABP9TLM7_9MICC
MKPVLPAGTGSRKVLALLAGLAALKVVGIVLVADALATSISQLAAGNELDTTRLLVLGLGGTVLRAGAVWATEFAAHRAGLGAKEKLRSRLMDAGLRGPGTAGGPGPGALAALASRGLDGLDNYYTKYLPALVSAMVIPGLVGVRILVADWVSALIVGLTIPLVPVFMILIGLHTQDRVKAAAAGLDRLSNQLLELAQGLPALIGLRRAQSKARALAKVSDDYRQSSMKTLRTAFLSGLALELIATISVAVVAVFIGVRLVYGNMGLEAGLLALILAPECYLPLRTLGAAFHASEDGVEALQRSEEFIGTGKPGTEEPPTSMLANESVVLAIEALDIRHSRRSEPALENVTLQLSVGSVHVLDAASGAGKTTLLHAVLGQLEPGAQCTGEIRVDLTRAAFISQHPRFTENTVAEEIDLHSGGNLGTVGLRRALDAANIGHLRSRKLVDCSPGELRRVAVARTLAKVETDPGINLVLADEPTAHLDEASAHLVRGAMVALLERCAVLVATHDRTLAAMLRGQAAPSQSAAGLPFQPAQGAVEPAPPAAPETHRIPRPAGQGSPLAHWKLLRSMPWFRHGLVPGLALAAAAAIFGVGLTGISGWLIVTASHQPPMLHLMVAIVGVRTFGIGRSVLRYVEQLRVHDAVFGFASRLRQRLWDALVAQPASWGRLTRSGAALGHLVAEVDEVRDAVPRVLVPPVASLATWGAVSTGIGFWAPGALPLALGLGLAAFVVLPLGVLAVERRSTTEVAEHRVWLGSRVPTLLRAAGDLRANRAQHRALAEFTAADARATESLRAAARGAGLAQGGAILVSSVAAVLAVAMAGPTGEAAAIAGLLLLALGEPIANTALSIQALPQLDTALRSVWVNIGEHTEANTETPSLAGAAVDAEAPGAGSHEGQRLSLRLKDADIGWAAGEPVLKDLTVAVAPGQWVAVTGPSGSGKSTLLACMLGALAPLVGSLETKRGEGHWMPAGAADLAQVAWCPQEAHLFDSSVRSNLCLGRESDDQPTDTELHGVLAKVGLGHWLGTLPGGLAERIGSGGHHLSGGQRQRLAVARALVARAQVLLLDEPTAHLGADEAVALVSDLRGALAGKAVLLVTHDAAVAGLGDSLVDLAALAELVPAGS